MSEGHKEICRVFASGKYCKFGKHCRYLHFRPPSLKTYHKSNKDEAINQNTCRSPNFKQSNQFSSFSDRSVEDGTVKKIPPENQSHYPTYRKYRRNENEIQVLNHEGSYLSNSSSSYATDDTTLQVKNGTGKCVKKPCHYFVKNGSCSFGDKCRFDHGTSSHFNIEEDKVRKPGVYDDISIKGGLSDETEAGKKNICRFYLNGYCRFGGGCNWSHTTAEQKVHLSYDKPPVKMDVKPVVAYKPPVQPSVFPSQILNNEEEQKKFRDMEINLFKKRYPKSTAITVESGECFKFVFSPTDPDWPYDVKTITLDVLFPKLYPAQQMIIHMSEEDHMIPNTVRRYIWKSIEEWIAQRFTKLQQANNAELAFRPFSKWLDKSLEDLFTAGLKLYQKELIAQAAGIELVPASELQERFKQTSVESDADEYSSNEDEESENQSRENPEEPDGNANTDGSEKSKVSSTLDPAKRGTEVKLHNLQLKENTSTLSVQKVHLILQCIRCKNKEELVTPTERINVTKCAKCFTEQLVTFRANLLHQFTNILGYIDVQGCSIFDMILAECDFIAGCFNCSTEAKFGNLPPGQVKYTWCQTCHAKLGVSADCAKFLYLQPSIIAETHNIHNVGLKARKPPKDPAIQEGKPLPDNGACKHYKKSFRWLRFPCCGKAYPCDVCHDDKEDHEMVFASRMICGYCAKEQPFAGDRPCKACNSYLIKKFSEHWEGGKGCRDKIKMSCGDKKKYANQNKTISKKSQSKSSIGAKNTKIRHN